MTAAQHPEAREAAQRVAHFLNAWPHPSRDDVIYSLGVHREDETRDLLASDLRTLLAALQ